MNRDEKIQRVEAFRALVLRWNKTRLAEDRARINREKNWVRHQVIEAGCFQTFTITPPPAFGGLIAHDVDAFAAMFNPPHDFDLVPAVIDMLDETTGVLSSALDVPPSDRPVVATTTIPNYAFVAMPMDKSDPALDDVLDAIKEAGHRCGVQAERVDDPQTNDRITDRILESIDKAEFVIADLTNARPNVYYEAGYAHARGKTPIYIARECTKLEFDLKDYPVIFFRSLKELKDALEKRLRGLGETRSAR